MDFIGPDLLYTYWVYAWVLIYFGILYSNPWRWNPKQISKFKLYANPIIGVMISLLDAIISCFFLFATISNHRFKILSLYLAMTFVVKIWPFWMLSWEFSNMRIYLKSFLVSFLFYFLYIHLRGKTILEIYRNTMTSLQTGKNQTPFFYLFANFNEP